VDLDLGSFRFEAREVGVGLKDNVKDNDKDKNKDEQSGNIRMWVKVELEEGD